MRTLYVHTPSINNNTFFQDTQTNLIKPNCISVPRTCLMRGLRIVTTSLSELTMIIFSIMERGSGEEPCCPNLVGDLGVPGGQYRTGTEYSVRHADRATCSRLFKLMEHVRSRIMAHYSVFVTGNPCTRGDFGLTGGALLHWIASLDDNVESTSY